MQSTETLTLKPQNTDLRRQSAEERKKKQTRRMRKGGGGWSGAQTTPFHGLRALDLWPCRHSTYPRDTTMLPSGICGGIVLYSEILGSYPDPIKVPLKTPNKPYFSLFNPVEYKIN
jgi:hypothetical protein